MATKKLCILGSTGSIGTQALELVDDLGIKVTALSAQSSVEKMEEHAANGRNYSGKCFISMSACMEDARAVAELVEERFPRLNGKVLINSIGTTIGSHTGPGTVALFFFGDERVN